MHLYALRSLMAALLALACSASQATLSFSWDLTDWQPVLGSRDTLLLRAQLFNDALSTETLRGDRLLMATGEGIEDAYDFMDSVPALADQLRNVVLAPGQSLDFVFGRLVPQGGEADPGRYQGGGFGLSFADDNGREVSWSPDRSLLVTVRDGGGSVPEPAPLALLAAGVLAALAFRPSSRPCR